MSWDASGYGSHAETGLAGPATTWYLAEGSTSGDFALFYLLQNPNPTATTATVRYLLPGGLAPDRAAIRARAPFAHHHSRGRRRAPSSHPPMFPPSITAPIPIIVERAMYMTRDRAGLRGRPRLGRRHGARPELVPRRRRDRAVLRSLHPARQSERVRRRRSRSTTCCSTATTLTKNYTVPADGRFTVWVDDEQIPAGSGVKPLDNVAVSSTIRSTNGVPIIVERTMWWPSPALGPNFWTEAHNSPGATAPGTRWALAEGEVGGAQGAETYVLIANTSAFEGQARVTPVLRGRDVGGEALHAHAAEPDQHLGVRGVRAISGQAIRRPRGKPGRNAGADCRRACDVHESGWGDMGGRHRCSRDQVAMNAIGVGPNLQNLQIRPDPTTQKLKFGPTPGFFTPAARGTRRRRSSARRRFHRAWRAPRRPR